MLNWFCVHTKPQQEVKAAIELTNQEFRVYLPVLNHKPLFPRYFFVNFDREIDQWGKIRSTRGCVDVLKNGFLPIPIPQSVMDAVMAFKLPEEDIQLNNPIYTIGQTVRIKRGLLAGYEGLFQGTDKQRTQALLTILGNKVSISFSDLVSTT